MAKRFSDKQVEKFEDWLRQYGRSGTTVVEYVRQVRRAHSGYKGPLDRLVDAELAPNTLVVCKAALKAWAEFSGDDKMLERIDKTRLPPSQRLKEKTPLTKKEWKRLRSAIDTAPFLDTDLPSRSVLGMMACRGFRVGDVLRLQPKEVKRALKTGNLVFVAKGRKRLDFTVGDVWSPYLEQLARERRWDYVWDLVASTSRPDQRYPSGARKVSRLLVRCAKRAKVDSEDLTPHLLRHTYATHYYQACKDPAMLQSHMQWSNISTAMGYVHAGSRKELDSVADSLF